MTDRWQAVKTIGIVSLLFILLIGCSSTAAPDRSVLKTTLQARLDSLVVESGVPGITFAVAFGDADVIHLAGGVADLESHLPMKPTARMFGGSTGKIWVAAVALKLIEEGRFGLDDKVADYLGSQAWYADLPNGRDITVRNLLNHTTGIPRHVMKPALWVWIHEDPDRYPSKEQCLSYVAGDQPVHAVGAGWGYSDTNYILLGLVIEAVTGERYEDLLRTRILAPYRLTLTEVQDSRVIADLPSGYTGTDAPFSLPAKVPVDGKYPIHPLFEWQGGGLVGNVSDMARWARILWGGRWLDKAMQEAMDSPVSLRTGESAERGWGLGVNVRLWQGHRVLSHGGIFPGYETFIAYFPDWDIAAALQMNADRTSGRQKVSPAGGLIYMIQSVVSSLERTQEK